MLNNTEYQKFYDTVKSILESEPYLNSYRCIDDISVVACDRLYADAEDFIKLPDGMDYFKCKDIILICLADQVRSYYEK